MELPVPDARIALLAGVTAGIVSPRVRRTVGRGIGFAAPTRGKAKAAA